ncbi:MAG: hypothetical protein ACP5E5_14825 [Acidobacteriaceae bacterium]
MRYGSSFEDAFRQLKCGRHGDLESELLKALHEIALELVVVDLFQAVACELTRALADLQDVKADHEML